MSAIDNTPQNRNFLSPLNFNFTVKKLPHVNFFVQKLGVPSVNLPNTYMPTPLKRLPFPGDQLQFGTLKIQFKVDEDLQNYLEIFNWLQALGKPESTDQYAALESIPLYSGEGLYSDASIVTLTGIKNANYEFNCRDTFPISLSEMTLGTTDSNVNYVAASAEFNFSFMTINKIT